MKEIIPLKKDIVLKTKIGELEDISLNHDYKINEGLIEGSVDISGKYKLTQASINNEEFFYSIPFSLVIANNVKKETICIDIDDFKYEINKDILSVNIDLLFTCEEENELEEYFKEEDFSPLNIDEEIEIPKIIEEHKEEISPNFNIENKYYTYKVYIVRKGDTISSIANKYNINIDSIKKYNDIDNLKYMDKIIIPMENE